MKNSIIYLVCGVPGSGKTWVCQKLINNFTYIANDDHFNDYFDAIVSVSQTSTKSLLIEAPFSVTKIKDPLEQAGYTVIPVFILETPEVVAERYFKREGKPISVGNLTRLETFKTRAKEWDCFSGTSQEVFNYLKSKGE